MTNTNQQEQLYSEIEKANFWSKAKQTGYCWEWQFNKSSHGYGMVRIKGKYTIASRVAYQIVNGSIPENMHILHKCDNPCCINPDHLFTGTHQDNMKDKERKGRGKVLGRGSKYLGVLFRSDSNKWRAYITVEGKTVRLGCFNSEEDAAKRRDDEVLKRGLDMPLNFQTIEPYTPPVEGKSNDWHLGNIHGKKEVAALQSALNDFKEECERLAGLVKFWQEEYYKINPKFIPPKIDNL